MSKITPLIKGIITGTLMVLFWLLLMYTNQPPDSGLQYISYVLYAGGIAWTLLDYSRSEGYIGKFGHIFGQGFRCFIIVTLIMVAFNTIFNMMHPEFAEQAEANTREQINKVRGKTPDEIEKKITEAKYKKDSLVKQNKEVSLEIEDAIAEAENQKRVFLAIKDKTPAEIETIISSVKKQFLTRNIMSAIFGTLTTGAIFTAAGAGLLLMRRKY